MAFDHSDELGSRAYVVNSSIPGYLVPLDISATGSDSGLAPILVCNTSGNQQWRPFSVAVSANGNFAVVTCEVSLGVVSVVDLRVRRPQTVSVCPGNITYGVAIQGSAAYIACSSSFRTTGFLVKIQLERSRSATRKVTFALHAAAGGFGMYLTAVAVLSSGERAYITDVQNNNGTAEPCIFH